MVKQIWNPDIVARASTLHIRARQLAWGYRFGHHRSPKVSRSIEFAEHKEYHPGDPIRDIDWRVYARTERLLVRRQQADTELSLVFVLGASADMALGFQSYPDWEQSHFGRAATLIASLTLLAQRRGERIALFIMGGTGYDVHWLAPKSSKNHMIHILNILASIKTEGKANLSTGLEKLSELIPKRSLVYILSDFMEEPAEWGPALCSLAAQKNDLRLIHHFSKKEFDFSFDEVGQFLSSEYAQPLSLDTQKVRTDFHSIVQEYMEEMRLWCGKSTSHYIASALEYSLEETFVRMIKGTY